MFQLLFNNNKSPYRELPHKKIFFFVSIHKHIHLHQRLTKRQKSNTTSDHIPHEKSHLFIHLFYFLIQKEDILCSKENKKINQKKSRLVEMFIYSKYKISISLQTH